VSVERREDASGLEKPEADLPQPFNRGSTELCYPAARGVDKVDGCGRNEIRRGAMQLKEHSCKDFGLRGAVDYNAQPRRGETFTQWWQLERKSCGILYRGLVEIPPTIKLVRKCSSKWQTSIAADPQIAGVESIQFVDKKLPVLSTATRTSPRRGRGPRTFTLLSEPGQLFGKRKHATTMAVYEQPRKRKWWWGRPPAVGVSTNVFNKSHLLQIQPP
jgi:hypothetical protein